MDTHRFELGLQAKALSEVADAAGVEIACRCGSVWITLDNDPRDVVLEAGQSFRTNESKRALIYALEPSRLLLSHCEAPRFGPVRAEPRVSWGATPAFA